MTCNSIDEQSLRSLFSLEAEQTIDCIQIYDEIDSTNSQALRQIQLGNTDNRLLIANSQTAGKGRRGREWLSPKNSGVYFSLTRRFSLDVNALQALSLVTAISVVEALHELGASGLQLKWPNDVLYEQSKLAGILLELQQKEGARYVVFGVGVNIELSADVVSAIDRPVTDLQHIFDELPSPSALMAALLNRICRNISLYESNGFSQFASRWNDLDCYRMSEIELQNGENSMIGKSLGVDAEGELLVQTTAGIESITAGEVFPSLRSLSDEKK
ncbi:MAG: biotin--[acetyl-CoA-carboxylase] ligase [Pseudohongiellaceae bacterium]